MVLALLLKISMSSIAKTVSSRSGHQDKLHQERDLMVASLPSGVNQLMTSSEWKSEFLMLDFQSQDIRVTQHSLKG